MRYYFCIKVVLKLFNDYNFTKKAKKIVNMAINLKNMISSASLMFICITKIVASDITSNIDDFLKKNVSEFMEARKPFIDGLATIKSIELVVKKQLPDGALKTELINPDIFLGLLRGKFPGYTFSKENDGLYVGAGGQRLIIGNNEYRSQIEYYHNSEQKLVNVINLKIIYAGNGQTVCETMGYTEEEDNQFHEGEPNATIRLFKEILAKENTTKVKKETTTRQSNCLSFICCCLFRQSASVTPDVG